jgi:hypothetical protein
MSDPLALDLDHFAGRDLKALAPEEVTDLVDRLVRYFAPDVDDPAAIIAVHGALRRFFAGKDHPLDFAAETGGATHEAHRAVREHQAAFRLVMGRIAAVLGEPNPKGRNPK